MPTGPVTPKEIAVTLDRDTAPRKFSAFQACPLTVACTLPEGYDFENCTRLAAELFTETGTEPVAASEVTGLDGGDIAADIEFTAAQMNQTIPGRSRKFHLVVYAEYPDDRLEVFRCADITLTKHRASQTTPAPPEPAVYLSQAALDAAVAALEAEIAALSSVHNDLTSRDAANAHPMGAITGLTAALDGKSAVSHGHLSADITDATGTGNDAGDGKLAKYAALDAGVGLEMQALNLISGIGYPKISHVNGASGAGSDVAISWAPENGTGATREWVAAQGYGSGDGDMLRANNLNDLNNVASARTNLGLGTADSPQFAGLGGIQTLTGAAGNMTIVAGTGNSRNLTLSATNGSGAAVSGIKLDYVRTWIYGPEGLLVDPSSGSGLTVFGASQYGVKIRGDVEVSFASGVTIESGRDVFFGRAGVANLRHGQADAASPVAQIDSVQNVAAGTSNTAGAHRYFDGCQSTGNQTGGSHIFRTAAAGSSGSGQNSLMEVFSVGLYASPGADRSVTCIGASGKNLTFSTGLYGSTPGNQWTITHTNAGVGYITTGGLTLTARLGFAAGVNNATDTSFSRNAAGVLESSGSFRTAAPNGGTAGNWKFGSRVAATVALDTTQYIELDVGGTLYKLGVVA